MSDLTMERTFLASAETVFDFVTKPEHLLTWWGPESMKIEDEILDFTQTGSWTSTMVNQEGGRFKVSGEVLRIDRPHSVEFTWAWHDDQDQRGHESTVRFDVKATGKNSAVFTLTQIGLADDESASNHNEGWTSSLRKLEKGLA